MIGVPARYIRDAAVDWAGELFACSGLLLPFGRAEIPPPSYMTWALMELIDCDFVHPNREVTVWGATVAAYIAGAPQQAAKHMRAHVAAGHHRQQWDDLTKCPLDDGLFAAAITWTSEAEPAASDWPALRDWLMLAFAGFQMIPSDNGTSGEQLFGMDQFAGIVSACGTDIGIPADRLLWETPLCIIGHVVAQKSKQNGAKGIARPKDREHIKEMIAAAAKWEAAGVLTPWQEADPLGYGLLGHENKDEAYRLAVLQHNARMKKKTTKEPAENG